MGFAGLPDARGCERVSLTEQIAPLLHLLAVLSFENQGNVHALLLNLIRF